MKKLALCIAVFMLVTAAFGQRIKTTTAFCLVEKRDSVGVFLPVGLYVSGMDVITTRVDEPIFVESGFPISNLASIYAGDTFQMHHGNPEIEFGWFYVKEIQENEYYSFDRESRTVRSSPKIIDFTLGAVLSIVLSMVFFLLSFLVFRYVTDFFAKNSIVMLFLVFFACLLTILLTLALGVGTIAFVIFGVIPLFVSYFLVLAFGPIRKREDN